MPQETWIKINFSTYALIWTIITISWVFEWKEFLNFNSFLYVVLLHVQQSQRKDKKPHQRGELLFSSSQDPGIAILKNCFSQK